MRNIAFIDGQNLYLGTREEDWEIDLKKFRIYLKDKYKVDEAYYFLGYLDEDQQELYNTLQKVGFIIQFKEHHSKSKSKKKGNVDTDIVFEIMKTLVEESFDKIILVSGDGDYFKLVKYLIDKDRFGKILFPNFTYTSSLYKKVSSKYCAYLGQVKSKIKY